MTIKEVFYDADFAKVIYYPEKEVLGFSLIGNLVKEDYQTAWNVLLDTIVEKKPKKIFVDQRQMSKASLEARAWLVVKWLPKFKKRVQHHIRVAVVLSPSIAMRIGGQFLMDSAMHDIPYIHMRSFEEEPAAMAWLNEA